MRLVLYAGAAALLVALTGCGSTAASSPGSTPSRTPTSATTSSAAPNSTRAVAVIFERAGGKAGMSTIARFAAGQTSSGVDPARVRAVLHAASAPALRSMHLPPMPQSLCCDRYTYTLQIRYADGSSRVIRTADGLRQPPQLRALLSAAS